MYESANITELLTAWSDGKEDAIDRLLPLVEAELRRIAHNYMRRENGNHTLQTTALVNEAFVKLVDQKAVNWKNRSHFFALSSQIMRRILLNHARDRTAAKRGGNIVQIDLSDEILSTEKTAELIALDDALETLAKFDRLKSRIVELRYFGGLTVEETAEVVGLAAVTVAVHWRLARAWLAREIRGEKSFV